MSELAFNMNGEAFEVPAAASGWRVRRMKLKGAPEVVYSRDGVPLVLPLDAEIDDVRREVGAVCGRYRLDPVDEHGRPLADTAAAYVYVHPEARNAEPALKPIASPATTDSVVIEAMRMNAEMARSVIDRFPLMMEAAAVLLRAADGAGLPARPGMVDGAPDDDADHAQPAAGSRSAFEMMLAQVVPMLVTGFMSGGGKGMVPSLGEMLDWRKAAPGASARTSGAVRALSASGPAPVDEATAAVDAGVEPMIPPLDAATLAHFLAVRALLTPTENALAGQIAKELSPIELRGLLDELAKLSVPDAATRVRALLAGGTKVGGAS